MSIPRKEIIDSLVSTGAKLKRGVPDSVKADAIAANPWFTAYYIDRALANILPWLERQNLEEFSAAYPLREKVSLSIAVITAGNLPFVGLHDVLIVLLSGHRLQLKLSHKDQVLVKWLVEEWVSAFPALKDYIRFVSRPVDPDFLIATGSNNTIRYIKALYNDISCLLRQNRFSLAVLEPKITDQELEWLCDDIFLYNGLGCRNVSNILYSSEEAWGRLEKKLMDYPKEKLNPLYLERVLHEKAKVNVWGTDLKFCENILIQSCEEPALPDMGILRKVKTIQETEVDRMLEEHQSNIQCIAGTEVGFGKTQCPTLKDFADNVDTMRHLVYL